jgi:hypothetical protein
MLLILTAMGCGDDGTSEPEQADVSEADTASEPDTATCTPISKLPEDVAPELAVTEELAPGLAGCLATARAQGEPLSIRGGGQKIAQLALGESGEVGQGLDVDADPATCAPAASCVEGVDNQLAFLAQIANPSLDEALEQGTLMLALDTPGLPAAGSAEQSFSIRMYTVYLDALDEDCGWQTDTCRYRVRTDSFDVDCSPLMELPASADAEGNVIAGGPDAKLLLTIPLFGVQIQVTAYALRMEATIGRGCEGEVTSLSGLMGGAINLSELKAALEAVPEEEFEAAGGDKSLLVSAVDLITPDFDTDDDGVADAASVGLSFSTIPGFLVGVTEPLP